MSGAEEIELRPAGEADVAPVARIWHQGWRDGHLGNVPDALAAVRTPESFATRAAGRVADTTVAVAGGAVAGFVMVNADEVDQVYLAAAARGSGIAAVLLAEAERQIRAAGHDRAWPAVVAGNARARRFYARSGWVDEGAFDYQAHGSDGPITVRAHRYAKALAG